MKSIPHNLETEGNHCFRVTIYRASSFLGFLYRLCRISSIHSIIYCKGDGIEYTHLKMLLGFGVTHQILLWSHYGE